MRADIEVLGPLQVAAASAATAYLYFPIPHEITKTAHKAFMFKGFAWSYQTAEANTDNTLDFVIAQDQDDDGTFDATGDTLHTNANAVGLLDSAAIGKTVTNKGDAASGGAAATAVTPTETRVDRGNTIRVAVTTAGTGTIPAINFSILGHWV